MNYYTNNIFLEYLCRVLLPNIPPGYTPTTHIHTHTPAHHPQIRHAARHLH